MIKLHADDLFTLTSREITAEGYLRAPANLARCGIQDYLAHELGLDTLMGMDPTRRLRLYRGPEEVFDQASLSSFENQPITINHPSGGVSAANWRQTSVGDVHQIARRGDIMVGVVIVRDEKAVKTVLDDGKTALSNGYDFELDLTPGVAPDGQKYDGSMKNIRGNHVAIVDAARCGSACKIADHNPEEGTLKMANRQIVIDGIPGEADPAIAAAVERQTKTLADTMKALDAANASLAATNQIKVGDQTFTVDQAAKKIADQAAEIETLKKDVMTPAARDAMVADWVKTLDEAKRLVPAIVTDGKTCLDIRREVVDTVSAKNPMAKAVADAVMVGKDAKTAEPETVRSAFNAIAAAIKTEDGTTSRASDATVAAALTGKDGIDKVADEAPTGRAAMMARSQDAWKGNSAAK